MVAVRLGYPIASRVGNCWPYVECRPHRDPGFSVCYPGLGDGRYSPIDTDLALLPLRSPPSEIRNRGVVGTLKCAKGTDLSSFIDLQRRRFWVSGDSAQLALLLTVIAPDEAPSESAPLILVSASIQLPGDARSYRDVTVRSFGRAEGLREKYRVTVAAKAVALVLHVEDAKRLVRWLTDEGLKGKTVSTVEELAATLAHGDNALLDPLIVGTTARGHVQLATILGLPGHLFGAHRRRSNIFIIGAAVTATTLIVGSLLVLWKVDQSHKPNRQLVEAGYFETGFNAMEDDPYRYWLSTPMMDAALSPSAMKEAQELVGETSALVERAVARGVVDVDDDLLQQCVGVAFRTPRAVVRDSHYGHRLSEALWRLLQIRDFRCARILLAYGALMQRDKERTMRIGAIDFLRSALEIGFEGRDSELCYLLLGYGFFEAFISERGEERPCYGLDWDRQTVFVTPAEYAVRENETLDRAVQAFSRSALAKFGDVGLPVVLVFHKTGGERDDVACVERALQRGHGVVLTPRFYAIGAFAYAALAFQVTEKGEKIRALARCEELFQRSGDVTNAEKARGLLAQLH